MKIARHIFLSLPHHDCADSISMSCIKNYSSTVSPIKCQEKSDVILRVNHLSKRFSDKSEKEDAEGLCNLTFTIRKGDITAIIGESGSGKSTLLRSIFGLLKIDAGEVLFRGEKVKGPDEQLIPGHGSMRMVSQHFDDLNTYANVWDNVASRLSNTDIENKVSRTRIVLERLRISKLQDQRIADLSGGEKQRVAIARALITEPDILLMDEPFNQIDSSFRDQLQSDIRQVVDETGLTVILVSHDPAEVMGLADYLILLQNGTISTKGNPYDLYQKPPNAYVARMLTKSNILTPTQAYYLGLKQQETAVHPEWINLLADTAGDFHVQRVVYRGFYEEVIINNERLTLRIYQLSSRKWEKGQAVDIQITRFVYL